MNISDYLNQVKQKFNSGNATEHSYRGLLEQLVESLVPNIKATNEPKRRACGAPDYILTKKDIPVGFIEAKDIGDLDLEGKKKNKEQFDRYRNSLSNLVFTDYLDFHLYQDGQFITKIAIAKITDNRIEELPENFSRFENIIKDFCVHNSQNIKSSKNLAQMMAGKARLLSDIIEKALTSDQENQENSTLKDQMIAFKEILIHDITPQGFADIYAQTITYGMFAARLHDPTLPTFSRQEAAELIPKSNPFLRKLFSYIAGPDIDDRIKWIVDNLAEIFLACNVEEILKNYGKSTKMEDPIIHFYENFLSEYDPKLRKARGVWYTPAPVVNFIVRAVDDILKTEFDLPQGLADISKTKITLNSQVADKRSTSGYSKTEQEVHKVQILDPATGTGTFLSEVIKHIHKKFEGQQGIWSNYVETHLLPRLNGFELLMASYAMAHLKLDLLLTETGYKPTKDQRFRVYLTNSLEEYHQDTGTLFASWLSTEANEANHIKRDAPVMCVIGNPPYAVSSANKSEWIQKLIADYKKDLNERKINLDDDYIKFIRYGQHFIDKNGSGVLAYISNNSFLDGITHRQMRKHLLTSFDKIYILDLHGNAKKKEVCPDGSVDQNVFDIMQGVSINIFVKTGKKKTNELGQVFHYDLQGKRDFKYKTLNRNSLESIDWEPLKFTKPNFFFVPKNFENIKEYNKGFYIRDLFYINGTGVQTDRDSLFIDDDFQKLENKIKFLLNNNFDETFRSIYNINDSSGFKITTKILNKVYDGKLIKNYNYKPFDVKKIYYDESLISRAGYKCNKNALLDNYILLTTSKNRQLSLGYVFVSKILNDRHFLDSAADSMSVFPLYLYPDEKNKDLFKNGQQRTPNLSPEIVSKIAQNLGLKFVSDHEINTRSNHSPLEGESKDEVLRWGVKNLSDKKNLDFGFNISDPSQNFLAENFTLPQGEGDGTECVLNSQTNSQEGINKTKNTFNPLDLLDYIYAVLHSPIYREKYKEFLKIDFPRVPYPKDATTFWQLVKLGGEIREVHLLESPIVGKYITQYPIDGSNIVDKIKYQDGKVYINETQYFNSVPQISWEFYIGGYQPAQKWLKDRKGRKLEFDDILHYQKIIVALFETDRLMKEIDKITF